MTPIDDDTTTEKDCTTADYSVPSSSEVALPYIISICTVLSVAMVCLLGWAFIKKRYFERRICSECKRRQTACTTAFKEYGTPLVAEKEKAAKDLSEENKMYNIEHIYQEPQHTLSHAHYKKAAFRVLTIPRANRKDSDKLLIINVLENQPASENSKRISVQVTKFTAEGPEYSSHLVELRVSNVNEAEAGAAASTDMYTKPSADDRR